MRLGSSPPLSAAGRTRANGLSARLVQAAGEQEVKEGQRKTPEPTSPTGRLGARTLSLPFFRLRSPAACTRRADNPFALVLPLPTAGEGTWRRVASRPSSDFCTHLFFAQ